MRLAVFGWQLNGELLLIGQAIEVRLAGAVPEQWEYRSPFCFVLPTRGRPNFSGTWWCCFGTLPLVASVLLTGETGSKRNRRRSVIAGNAFAMVTSWY